MSIEKRTINVIKVKQENTGKEQWHFSFKIYENFKLNSNKAQQGLPYPTQHRCWKLAELNQLFHLYCTDENTFPRNLRYILDQA